MPGLQNEIGKQIKQFLVFQKLFHTCKLLVENSKV